jgi:SAM-dependent methyltransferase
VATRDGAPEPPGGASGPGRPEGALDLKEWFSEIDIYLFDQILKGRFRPGMSVLDAGCGNGRNLRYFLRSGYDVHAVDLAASAVAYVRDQARALVPGIGDDHFRVEPVERMSYGAASFDLVISSAVLHFAKDEDHFLKMVTEMWRVLRPGGILFARLSSTIGMEAHLVPLGEGRFRLPDGAEWFLVNEATLLSLGRQLGAELVEPIKSVQVQNIRTMTAWVLRKPLP